MHENHMMIYIFNQTLIEISIYFQKISWYKKTIYIEKSNLGNILIWIL